MYFGAVVPVLARRRALPSAAAEVVDALSRDLVGGLLRDDVVDVYVTHGAMGYSAALVRALVRRQLNGAFGLRLPGTTQVLAEWARNHMDNACVEGTIGAGVDLYRRVHAKFHVRHAVMGVAVWCSTPSGVEVGNSILRATIDDGLL
jgi:hypothetical protein